MVILEIFLMCVIISYSIFITGFLLILVLGTYSFSFSKIQRLFNKKNPRLKILQHYIDTINQAIERLPNNPPLYSNEFKKLEALVKVNLNLITTYLEEKENNYGKSS